MQINNHSKKDLIVWILVVGFVATIYPVGVWAAEKEIGSPESVFKGWHYAPYCGLYCLYVFTRMADNRIQFKDLVKPEYVSSNKGSSLKDILKAAEDHGFHAKSLGKLTINDLRRSPYPMILHVKGNLEAEEYDHYELFVGDHNNRARLVNPPHKVQTIAYRDLVPRWGGDALLLSTKPINLSIFKNPRRNWLIVWAIVGAVIVLSIRYSSRWFKQLAKMSLGWSVGLSIGQAAGLALLAFLCGIGYHIGNDAGFLVLPRAVSTFQKVHVATFIPKISVRRTRRLLGSGTIFVDARLARDFKAGHLKGAISVPVNTTDEERQTKTANIPKDARIVLYCQSAGCKFAEKVAIRLMDDDFSNISIFKGGWAEWVAKNGRKKDKQI